MTKVLPDKPSLDQEIMLTAQAIASKSPIAVHALKQVIKRQFKNKQVEDSLDYIARVNSSMLLTKDTTEAITAFFQKRKPAFSKL